MLVTSARATGCPVCRTAGRACVGHPSTTGRHVVDLPASTSGGGGMPLIRETRTTPSGMAYVVKVPAPVPAPAGPAVDGDETAAEHNARPAPLPGRRRRRAPDAAAADTTTPTSEES